MRNAEPASLMTCSPRGSTVHIHVGTTGYRGGTAQAEQSRRSTKLPLTHIVVNYMLRPKVAAEQLQRHQ